MVIFLTFIYYTWIINFYVCNYNYERKSVQLLCAFHACMGYAQIYIKPPSQFVLAVLVHVGRYIGLGTCSVYSLHFSLSLSDVTARNE